ncbi:MAG: helix-turn-helix domain-containing protein [Acidimicrobiales bacterium]
MSRRSPFEIRLSSEDRAILVRRASSGTAPHREVVRARIVLLGADGVENVEIARRVGVCVDVASKWRKRFCEEGVEGLTDRHRSGRPRRFDSKVVAGIKAMACEPPEGRQVPLSRWSSLELAAQAVTEGLVESISSSTVRRWLHAAAIKPWRYRSWIFPRDPDFAQKAARVLDLYARVFDGFPLGPDDHIISADEKSQLQALRRIVFSIIQRKVIKPADFADLAELGDRLGRFEHHYNATARPFDWRFSSRDLAAMLDRLDAGPAEAPLAA